MKPATRQIIVLVYTILCIGVLSACTQPQVADETRMPVEWTIITVKTVTPTLEMPTATVEPTDTSTPASTPTPSPTPTGSIPVCPLDEGEVRDDAFESAIMKRTIELKVYLPPCYDPDGDKDLPVLYLLHGLGADNNQWVKLGIPGMMDRLVSSGEITPYIIVFPQEPNFYTADATAFDRMIIEELRPYVDAQYNTKGERIYRAIGGLSRGAAWSLRIGATYPQFFTAIGLHSLAIFEGDDVSTLRKLSGMASDERPAIFIDIGTSDPGLQVASEYEQSLNLTDVEHTWYQFSGGHTEAYWQAHAMIYLRWYATLWQ
jgi:enterochelin esterase-like enzyme